MDGSRCQWPVSYVDKGQVLSQYAAALFRPLARGHQWGGFQRTELVNADPKLAAFVVCAKNGAFEPGRNKTGRAGPLEVSGA